MSKHAQRPERRDQALIRVVATAIGVLVLAGVAWQLRVDQTLGSPAPAAAAIEPAVGQRAIQKSVPGLRIDLDPEAWATQAAKIVRKAATPQRVLQAPKLARSAEWLANQRTLSFRVATFNVLGASHTDGNDKRGRRYASGATRMSWAVGVIGSTGASVVGMQELQGSQYGVLRSRLPGWGVYPGASLGSQPMNNSITWNGAIWEAVETHAIDIPYFGGRSVPMPYVLLRDKQTGRTVWFANFHNPADTHGNAAGFRARAVALEVALATQLSADGTPVIITGDMNDRSAYFCPATASGLLHAAIGGGTGAPCQLPSRTPVDWIMGTLDAQFANFALLDGGLIDRITDHFVLASDVTLAPSATG